MEKNDGEPVTLAPRLGNRTRRAALPREASGSSADAVFTADEPSREWPAKYVKGALPRVRATNSRQLFNRTAGVRYNCASLSNPNSGRWLPR